MLGRVSGQTVLVTGASTGIGAATAAHLARLGFTVLAGVRRTEDAERIRAPKILPVRLDVTDEATVFEAARLVDRVADGGLAGLVNNAGIAVIGPVEALALSDWRRQIEVNLLGNIAVTTALLPALLRSRGRIINISSICGRIALPLLGPYTASKFGLESFSDTLRREVGRHGVRVVCVEPGMIVTPMWDKGRADGDARLADLHSAIGHRYAGLIRAIQRLAESACGGLPATAVAKVVGRALTAARPRTRYIVGTTARGQMALARMLSDRIADAVVAGWLRAR